VLSVNGLLIATVQPWSTRLLKRLETSRVLAVSSLLVGAGYGAYALCSTTLTYAIATAVWSLGEIFALPRAAALVADLSPESLRGSYQGVFAMSLGLAAAISPLLGAAGLERLGASGLWAACLVVSLGVALGQLLAGPTWRRREAAYSKSGPLP
jgi:hypothetical protein